METLDTGSGSHPRAWEVDGNEAIVAVDEAELVIEWSCAASRLFGYEREEALGRELGALIVPAGLLAEHQRWFAEQLERHASHRAPFETRMQRSTGEQVPVRIEATRTTTAPPSSS